MMASVSFSTWLLLARRELCDRPGEGEHDHRDGHRLFFCNFQSGDSCTFSQGFRRFSENLRWPSRDEMAGRLHGELYAFSSRNKFPLGHSDQVESSPGVISSRARHVNTCTHTCTNRVEVSSFSYNIIAF